MPGRKSHFPVRKTTLITSLGTLFAIAALAMSAGFLAIGGMRSESVYITLILILIALLLNSRSTLLIRLYCAYLLLVFVVPTVGRWIIGDISLQYDQAPYTDALEYIFFYNCVFAFCFVIFSRERDHDFFGAAIENHSAMFRTALVTLLLSLLATGYLSSTGNFRALDSSEGGRLLGLITAFSELGILGFVILGALSLQRRSPVYHLPYLAAFVLLGMLGTLSGSRWYLAQIFLLMYIVEDRRGRYRGMIIMVVALPVIALSFPLLGSYRDYNYDVSLAIDMFRNIDGLGFFIIDTVLADRMNYVKIVQRVIETVQNRSYLLFDYIDNFTGLIPRFVWPDKPVMGLDLNRVGFELGIINASNYTTSIGLGVVGESFYQLKTLGVLIAVLQAALFRFVEGLQKSRDMFWRFSYVSFCLIIIVKDSYMYVVPLLITHLVVVSLASWSTRALAGRVTRTGDRDRRSGL